MSDPYANTAIPNFAGSPAAAAEFYRDELWKMVSAARIRTCDMKLKGGTVDWTETFKAETRRQMAREGQFMRIRWPWRMMILAARWVWRKG